MTLQQVNRYTKAPISGKRILCPNCERISIVYHFSWCAIKCQHCNQFINKEDFLVVKFGQEYNDEDNEILVLPYGEHKVILDQYLNELVILSLPRKRVHPGVEDGTLESEIIKILDELKPSGLALESDPRWEKLKKIKNK